MPASVEEIEEAEADGVKIVCGWGPKAFKTTDGVCGGITFKKCTQVKNAEGRFDPQYDEDDTMDMDADYVITSIGQCIDWGSLLDGEEGMEYVHGNYPKADKFTYQTGVSDIFVGGDLYHGPSFVINAIGEGHEAAESIHRYVQPWCDSLTLGRVHRHFEPLDKEDMYVDGYDKSPRQKPELKTGVDKWSEYVNPFTEEQVKVETARCLSCGASRVDEVMCIGCGICTTKCAFDAIHLHRTRPQNTNMISAEEMIPAMLPYAAERYTHIAKINIQKLKDKIRN